MPRHDRRATDDRGGSDDRGETLIELLITVSIMGITVVAILGAIATSISLSVVHRKQATAGALLRGYAEAIETAVAGSPSAYKSCAKPVDYASIPTAVSGAYTASITAITYGTGTPATSFSTTCGSDSGVQQVTLKVASTDGKVTETLTIVIRRPCRSTTDFPLDTACT